MGQAHRLVKANDLEGLKQFVASLNDAKPTVNEVDDNGYSPLFCAVSATKANPELVRFLLETGADPRFAKVTSYGLLAQASEVLESTGIKIPKIFKGGKKGEHRESVLSAAIKQGNLEVIQLFRQYGADLSYQDSHRYTAILDLIYGNGDQLPVLQYLIGLGLPVDVKTTFGESAIKVAYHRGQFEVVAALIHAGAGERDLQWTPLHRAIAIGSREEVEAELDKKPRLNADDLWHRTPVQLAILKGDAGLVDLLCARGADLNAKTPGDASLCLAVQSGNTSLIEWLVANGCPVDSRDQMGQTCLQVAAAAGDHKIARLLLDLGADPNASYRFGTLIEGASDQEMTRILLDHGADLADLNAEGRRRLVGLGEQDQAQLDAVTRDQYLAGRYPREGQSNPEQLSDPFRIAMIRAGVNAYRARKKFDDPATIVCGLKGHAARPVWCADRFGQSTTILPDGRIVFIAGEHEDSYDPDFCIYNDVFVFEPDGEIRIYGYPYSVFPPTDFHSATLVGDFIYIIGSLGYMDSRSGDIPVCRLNTTDFQMEPLVTTGDVPGRIHDHRAKLIGNDTIRIFGGQRIGRFEGPNKDILDLNLTTLQWSKR